MTISLFARFNGVHVFCMSAWRAGLRSRSVQGVLVLGVLLVGVAFLSAFFSPRQPKTVAMDVGFSGLRISLVLLALFWVQELIGAEIERRTVLLALTYPVPRWQYLIGRYLGILGLLGLAAVLLGMLLWLAVLMTSKTYDQFYGVGLGLPFWLSVGGLWLDAALIAAFALWVATYSTVPMLPLTLGLAVAMAGKSLGSVIEYLSKEGAGDAQLQAIIGLVQWVLPDLSRLDWRVSAMYNLPFDFVAAGWGVVMAASYTILLLVLASMSFERRQFQ